MTYLKVRSMGEAHQEPFLLLSHQKQCIIQAAIILSQVDKVLYLQYLICLGTYSCIQNIHGLVRQFCHLTKSRFIVLFGHAWSVVLMKFLSRIILSWPITRLRNFRRNCILWIIHLDLGLESNFLI